MRFIDVLRAATGAVALALPVFAAATPIAVANFNFESPAAAKNEIRIGPVSGWGSAGGLTGTFDATYPGFYTSTNGVSGSTVLFLFHASGSAFEQTTSHSVVAGELLSLTVAVGSRSTGETKGALIELWDADSKLAGATVTNGPTTGDFGDYTLTYTVKAGDSGALRIRLGQSGGDYADFDNVRLSTGSGTAAPSVPEPGSMALVIPAAVALAFTRRKRGLARRS